MEFAPWPKIPRLNRGIVISEKINGTNACVRIRSNAGIEVMDEHVVAITDEHVLYAQSRKRFVQPGKPDNMGFAGWVAENAITLAECLGEGDHYGEWWGAGIQKNPYGLEGKRFSLFNTSRWGWLHTDAPELDLDADQWTTGNRLFSASVDVVPTLYKGPWTTPQGFAPDLWIEHLKRCGSHAFVPSDYAEGIVIYTLDVPQGPVRGRRPTEGRHHRAGARTGEGVPMRINPIPFILALGVFLIWGAIPAGIVLLTCVAISVLL